MYSRIVNPKLWGLVFTAAAILVHAGCRDDSPSAPRVQNVLTVSPQVINFGNVCQTTIAREFYIKAPATNTKPVKGTVSEDCGNFFIAAGSGDYTLEPGDSLLVDLRFVGYGGGYQTCEIETGPAAPNVTASANGQVYAFMKVEPVSGSTFRWSSNYFTSAPKVTLDNTTIERPSWAQCRGFRIQGSPFEENGVTIGNMRVPGSCSSISIGGSRDAESGCNQRELLVQLDGNREYYFTAPLVCSGGGESVPWPWNTTATHAVMIGLDQSNDIFCYADVVCNYFNIRFRGVCVNDTSSPSAAVAFGEDEGAVYGGEGEFEFGEGEE